MATKALDVAKTRVLPPAVEWYNATMAKNAQYVVKDPEAVDKLGKQLIFSNMAKLPAAVEAAQGEIKVVQQKWANRMELPMTEVRSRRPFAHRIRRARPASSFPRERCWQHRGTPTLTHLPLSLTAGWHRRPLLRGGVRVVLRRGNHRPRREPDRLLSAPPDRRRPHANISPTAPARDDARELPVVPRTSGRNIDARSRHHTCKVNTLFKSPFRFGFADDARPPPSTTRTLPASPEPRRRLPRRHVRPYVDVPLFVRVREGLPRSPALFFFRAFALARERVDGGLELLERKKQVELPR